MKIKELVAFFLEMDQELEVYTAADSEGNYYNRVGFEPSEMLTPANPGYRIEEVFSADDIEDCGYEPEDLVKIAVI